MKAQEITIIKRGGNIDTPIKMFKDWHKAGQWCDDNIKSDFQLYYFDKFSKTKTLWFKILLWWRNFSE